MSSRTMTAQRRPPRALLLFPLLLSLPLPAAALRPSRTGSVLCLVNDSVAGGHSFAVRQGVSSRVPQGAPPAT